MNRRADFIIPECYIDTNLVETLICHAGCNHQKGCNQVAKVMQEKFAERFAVGVIDADKRRPGYLCEFKKVATGAHLEVYRHKSRPHFIVMVHPAIDGFILSCVENGDIDLSVFGLPTKLKDFTKQTKDVLSNKDERFRSLFRAMSDVGEMATLKKLIEYLCETSYRACDEDVIMIVQG